MSSYSKVSEASDDGSETPFLESPVRSQPKGSRFLRVLPWVIQGLLLSGNIIFFYIVSTSWVKPTPRFNDHQPFDDSMMEYTVRKLDKGWGEQNPKNASERIFYTGMANDDVDEAWLRLYYPIQKLRITEEERAQAGLNTAQYPDGSGDYISSLDVAHQIHCLDEVRKATNPEYYKPMVNDKLQKDHIAHCINYIRQILMCRADVTLLEYHDVESAGLGSERQRTTFDSPHMCADYGKIYDWAWNKRIKFPEERILVHYPYADDIAKGIID